MKEKFGSEYVWRTRPILKSKLNGGNKVKAINRVFSRDVTAAVLVSVNKGTAAMLVSSTNPPGTELYS